MKDKKKIAFSILASFLGISVIVEAGFFFEIFPTKIYYPILMIIAAVFVTAFCLSSIFKRKETMFKLTLLTLVIAVIVAAAYIALQKTGAITWLNDTKSLAELFKKTGVWGPLAFILIQFLQVTFVPIPSVVTTAAGLILFENNIGLVFVCSLVGMMAGSMFAFFLGRVFGVKLLIWMVGAKAYNKYQKMLKGRDSLMLFMMFLLPVFPDDLLCIFAGVTSMSYTTFFIMQIITRPIAIISQAGTMDIMSKIPLTTWWGILIWVIVGIAVVAMFVCLWKYSNKLENLIVKIIKKYFGANELSLTIDKEKLNSDVQNLISDTIIDADKNLSVSTNSKKQKYKAKKYQINYKE